MRPSLVLFVVFFSTAPAIAQVGIGTESPNPHAVLDLRAPGNNQGFLVPRLTTAQRTTATFTSTLSTTDNGMLVFDSDMNKFFYWQVNAWIQIDLPQDLNLTGSTLTITNNPSATPVSLSAFTGTNTDDQSLTYNPLTGQLTITRLIGPQVVTISSAGSAGGGAFQKDAVKRPF